MKASFAVLAVAATFLAAPAQSQAQPQPQPTERWGPGGAGGQQGGNWGGQPGGPSGGSWGGQGWLPQGSYQQSCRSASVRGTGRKQQNRIKKLAGDSRIDARVNFGVCPGGPCGAQSG